MSRSLNYNNSSIKGFSSKRRRATRNFILLLIFAITTLLLSRFLQEKSYSSNIIAVINNRQITKEDFINHLQFLFDNNDINKISAISNPNSINLNQIVIEDLPIDIIDEIVKKIYIEKELLERANRSSILKEDRMKKQISRQIDQITISQYLSALAKSRSNNDAINSKYLEFSKDFEGKKEYKISQIIFDNEQDAIAFYEKASHQNINQNNKTNTNKYKEENDEEDEDNDDKNNKLISDKIDEDFNKNINQEYLNDKLIPAELINLLAIMNKNDITRPIQLNNKWHIVKLFDYRFIKIPSFEEVKEKLVSEINNNIRSDLEQEILSGAKIEYKYLKR